MYLYLHDEKKVCFLDFNTDIDKDLLNGEISKLLNFYQAKESNKYGNAILEISAEKAKEFYKDLLLFIDLSERMDELKDLKLSKDGQRELVHIFQRSTQLKKKNSNRLFYQATHAYLDVFLTQYYDLKESTDTHFDVQFVINDIKLSPDADLKLTAVC